MRVEMVNVSPSYPVYIGRGILGTCGEYLKKHGFEGKVAIVTDNHVAPLYLEQIIDGLHAFAYATCSIVIEASEESKSMQGLTYVLESMAKEGIRRSDVVVALGGGVVGDLAGFAAACYMRGMALVQIPTTLLSQVDSSVGGKTAINLSYGKNLAGAFKQPEFVVCDLDTLESLPKERILDGMAEAFKMGVLAGEEVFSLFEEYKGEDRILDIVSACVKYKASVVEKDPTEKGIRKLLNLGHTVAHGIEKLSHYEISHGHAVAMGIALIVEKCEKEGKLSSKDKDRMINAMEKEGLYLKTTFDMSSIAREAFHDKKRNMDGLQAIIPYGIGDVRIENYSLPKWEEFLAQ